MANAASGCSCAVKKNDKGFACPYLQSDIGARELGYIVIYPHIVIYTKRYTFAKELPLQNFNCCQVLVHIVCTLLQRLVLLGIFNFSE